MDDLDIQSLNEEEKKLLNFLQRVARRRLECPTNSQLHKAGFKTKLVSTLARKGYIRLFIYSQGKRVVEICFNDVPGPCTMKPENNQPLRVIGRDPAIDGTYRQPYTPLIPNWMHSE